MLTPNADTETSSSFVAPISTIDFVNGNTLNSGDSLTGTEGVDTLTAELISDGFSQSGRGAVRPTTESIENVVVNAIDTTADNSTQLNAANMLDVVNIWSKDSNANLIIEDLTTKTSDGGVRNTEALTFRMDHTSNDNQMVNDASDLEVYFDQNYLLAGEVEDVARVQYEVMNQDAFDLIAAGQEGIELLDGVTVQRLSFDLNGERINLQDELGENDDATGTVIRTHQDLADAINAALEAREIDGQVTAQVRGTFDERSGTNTTETRSAPIVELVGAPGVELGVNENFIFLAPADENPTSNDGTLVRNSNRYDRAGEGPTDAGSDLPITTNVELFKAGRGSDGGNVLVGGSSTSDSSEGVEVFNVSVLGADHKPSNVGYIGTTGESLREVNIDTHADFVGGDSVASLEIRDGFGTEYDGQQGDLVNLVNANDFLGTLTIGTDQRITNVAEFTATGGGSVNYFADYNTSADHSITTGNAGDFIDVVLSGNDSGSADSRTSVEIDTQGGDDTVVLSSGDDDPTTLVIESTVNDATVTTGDGNDVITGGANDLTVDAGAGNDVIYAENTGDFTTATLAAGSAFANTMGGNDTNGDFVTGNEVSLVSLLNNRDVRLTLQFPGDHVVPAESFENGIERNVTVRASEGEITTERDLYEAVAKTINEDTLLSSLAVASVDSNGTLSVAYKVDGATVADDDALVQIETAGDIEESDISSNLLSAIRSDVADSNITAANLADLHNEKAAATANVLTEGTDSATGGVNGGENVVKGAAGDDLIVLSSDDATQDTLVYDADANFGRDTIVHFNDGEDGDVLDFSDWLNNTETDSTSAVSARRVDIDDNNFNGTGESLDANGVGITTFNNLNNLDANVDFGNLNASDIEGAMDALNSGDKLVSGEKAILLVENDDNLGVYKVFQLEGNSDNDATADLVGTLDFGESQTFHATNFA